MRPVYNQVYDATYYLLAGVFALTLLLTAVTGLRQRGRRSGSEGSCAPPPSAWAGPGSGRSSPSWPAWG